jgi:IS5 family transposase
MRALSQIWGAIQGYLFPYLTETLGSLTEKQKQLVAILELVRVEEFVRGEGKVRGRKRESRRALARAFVAQAVYNWKTTRELIEELGSNLNLRWLCGYEKKEDLPHESTFSRAFEEFAVSELPQRVHAALIEKHRKEEVGGHISRDSTVIEGREKPVPRPTPERKPRKRGRPRRGEERPPKEPTVLERQAERSLEALLKELPQRCDRGVKRNSRGYQESWTGYKLHVDCADGQIPVSAVLSSASVHDSQVAIPLAKMTAQRVTNLYDLMDAAYDAEPIREYSRSLGHVPIIDRNPRRGEKMEMDAATKERYQERTSAERVFSRFKDEFGGETVRVRGPVKVMAHLMFGILVLTADQLLRLVM